MATMAILDFFFNELMRPWRLSLLFGIIFYAALEAFENSGFCTSPLTLRPRRASWPPGRRRGRWRSWGSGRWGTCRAAATRRRTASSRWTGPGAEQGIFIMELIVAWAKFVWARGWQLFQRQLQIMLKKPVKRTHGGGFNQTLLGVRPNRQP